MPAQYPGNSTTKAARAKAGGGYESAIEEVVSGTPAITSVTDNGDGTLTISGSGFGTKIQAAPRYWEMGSDVRVDGTAKTAPALGDTSPDATVWGSWTSPGTPDPADSEGIKVVSGNARHAGVDRHWRAWGKGTLLSPQFIAPLSGDDGREFYFAYRVYTGARFGKTRIYSQTEGLTGAFGISSTRQGGEVCDLQDGGGATIESAAYRLVWLSPTGVATITAEAGAQNLSTMQGYTLVGTTSGARVTISAASPDDTGWSVKHMRYFQDGLGSANQFYGSLSNVNNGQFIARIYDEAGNYTAGAPRLNVSQSGVDAPGNDFPNQWSLIEILGNLKTNDGWVEYRLNGVRKHLVTGINTDLMTSTAPISPNNVGLDSPGFANITAADAGFGADFGEMYFDSSSKRVLITDSADLATSTKFEIQRPQSWADDSVTVAKYDGEITGTKYVHVLSGTDYSGGVAV